MGIYNTFYYGDGTKYGNLSKLAYSTAPFTATALRNDTFTETYTVAGVTKYRTVIRPNVSLTWTLPSGTVLGLRVLRNQDGFSENESDGYVISETFTPAQLPVNVTDQMYPIPLVPGRYAYYTIWVLLADNSWYLSASDVILIPESHGINSPEGIELVSSADKFVGLLPRVYTSSMMSGLDEIDKSTDLYKFLQGFAYSLDEILTFADLMVDSLSGKDVNPNFVSVMAQQLGLPSMPMLSLKTQKKLIRQAVYMYQHKGTLLGLKTFVNTVTGYATNITVSPNLLLSPQDSSFYMTTGFWVAGTGVALTADTAYGASSSEIYSVNRTYSGKAVTTGSNQTISLGNDTPITKGIPVNGRTVYSLAYYVSAVAAGNTITPTVTWYDYTGTVISSTVVTAASVTTSWAKQSAYVTAPSTAYFAGLTYSFSAAATYYVDMIQFADATNDISHAWTGTANGSTSTETYVNTALTTRTNMCTNPSFETNTTGWVSISGGTLTSDATRAYVGTNSLKIVAAAVAYSGATYSFTAVIGTTYTISAYIWASAGTSINFAQDNMGGASTITGTSSWQRFYYTGVATTTTVNLQFRSADTTAPTFWVDAVLIEQSLSLGSYFDGSTTNTLVASTYNEARGVSIYLAPTKLNYLENPSFVSISDTDDGNDWGFSSGNTLDWSLSTTVPGVLDGSHMLHVTTSASIPFSMYSNTDPVPVSSYYTFSVYAKTASGTSPLSFSIAAYDIYTNQVITNNLGANVSATYTPTGGATSTWTRYYVTVYVPSYIGSAYLRATVSTPTSSVSDLYFDAAQIEAGYTQSDFFDGDYLNRGASWTGDVNDSISIIYPSKLLKLSNLKNNISAFLPTNTAYVITTGYGSYSTIEGLGFSS